MKFDIDTVILVIYILVNVGLGLYWGRNVKNIKDYALGGRNFSTGTLVATVMVVWVGGDELFVDLEQVYTTGLHFIIASIGQVLCLLLLAYVFIPRMGEFLGDLSMAESIGKLYGKRVRIIAALSGSLVAAGYMAVQFKVFGDIFKNYLGVSDQYTIFAAGTLVVMYSAFGGMRSVAFTDVIQFFTFGVLIPVLSLVLWNEYISINGFSFANATNSPLFDYKEFIGLSNPKFHSLSLLFILFLIPAFHPSLFQKVTMGRNVAQVKSAFIISAVLLLLILLGISWIGFLLFNVNPNLAPDTLVHHIIGTYAHPGLKGFILIGIVAMCMSKADTNLNSASVILTYDFCSPLGIKLKNELFLSKLIAITLGCGAMFIASLDYDLLSLIFLGLSFNYPMISPPLLLAILGFRSTEKAALIGIAAGGATVLIWLFCIDANNPGDSIVPGMIINTIFFMGSHYLLKQSGGWVGIKNQDIIVQTKIERQRKISRIMKSLRSFNFVQFCKNNAPKNELTYTSFGIFALISTICTMYSVSTNHNPIDKNILLFFYEPMLIISVSFVTYPIWPQAMKKETPVQIAWNLSALYILIICSTFFVMVNNFSQVQIIISMVNLIVVATLMRWQAALIFMILGVCTTIGLYQHYMGFKISPSNILSLELKIVYFLLLISSMLIMFFKPKQEQQELTEAKNDHLGEKIQSQKDELENLINLKNEFLRNLTHELHTPVTGITSMAGAMLANEKNMTKAELVENIRIIAQSSDLFNSYTDSILDLAKLSSTNFKLNITTVNLSELLYERLEYCIKLYLNDKRIEIITDIGDNIVVNWDKHYMQLVFDNLIINSINYSKDGRITIWLKKDGNKIEFSIEDEGIGIPKDELFTVFEPFTVSSKTKTPSGGRGIGLALVKKSIEAHGGTIWAQSDGKKGSTFIFEIDI